MRGGREEVLDEIAFFLLGCALACLHADDSLSAAALRAECAHSRPLNKTAMCDTDDAAFVGDEILHVDLALIERELRQPR